MLGLPPQSSLLDIVGAENFTDISSTQEQQMVTCC